MSKKHIKSTDLRHVVAYLATRARTTDLTDILTDDEIDEACQWIVGMMDGRRQARLFRELRAAGEIEP